MPRAYDSDLRMGAAQYVLKCMIDRGLGITIDGGAVSISVPHGFDFTDAQREVLMDLKPELFELVKLEVC